LAEIVSRRKKTKAQPAPGAKAVPVWRRWWAGKGPLFCFGAGFVGLIALFSAITMMPFFQGFVASYLQLDARLASKVLNWMGQQTQHTGDTIVSSRFAVTVLSECSANEFVIFLWAGLLAFPATMRRKIVGLVLGTLGIFFVNLVRVVTLFLIGAHRPRFFATVHEQLWPGLFIIVVVLFVAGWASWATRKGPSAC
jgi:exosortase H (IPTLxxWG-CTERM-specific)